MKYDTYPIIIVQNDGKEIPSFVYKKDNEYTITEDRAKPLLRKRYKDIDNDGNIIYDSYADLIEDLGIHIGRSKHVYQKNGLSKVTNKAI